MPFLFNTWPSAPIIIPLTALIVALVAIILLVAHLLRRLVGCPHKTSKYPFETGRDLEKRLARRSELPSSPYTIDPSNSDHTPTASSSSIYFLKGTNTATGAALLYPGLSGHANPSAPSRSPSSRAGGRGEPDDSFEGGSSLDQVDHDGQGSVIENLLGDRQNLSSTPLGGGYETLDERTTFRAEVSYHRSEMLSAEEHYPSNDLGGSNSAGAYSNYESDV